MSDNNIQHKPTHQASEYGFDDNGERVLAYRPTAPTPEHQLMEDICEALAGKPMPDYLFAQTAAERETLGRVKDKITNAFDKAKMEQLVKSLGYIMEQVKDKADAESLQWILNGRNEPLRELGGRVGMSAPGILKRINKLQASLRGILRGEFTVS